MTTVEGGTFGVQAFDAAGHPKPTMPVTFRDGRRPAEPYVFEPAVGFEPTTWANACLSSRAERGLTPFRTSPRG